MPKFFVGPLVLVIALLPITTIAQTTTTGPQDGQAAVPSTPHSGAGIPGQPGNKSGPPAKKPQTTGSDANTGMQDASKIPGKPGSKSGPAVRSPSSKEVK